MSRRDSAKAPSFHPRNPRSSQGGKRLEPGSELGKAAGQSTCVSAPSPSLVAAGGSGVLSHVAPTSAMQCGCQGHGDSKLWKLFIK